MRPVWVEVRSVASLTATGTFVTDLLATGLDDLQKSTRTIVAIKGVLAVRGAITTTVLDTLEYYAGFIVGSASLSSTDFPSLGTAGVVNPGWMWRAFVYGSVAGDGVVATQVVNQMILVDVKSKRSLAGLGDQTLHIVHRIADAVPNGNAVFSGQVLLAAKG